MKANRVAPPYCCVAPFYDQLMKGQDYARWAHNYTALLARAGIVKGKLLELGCGTGAMTAYFAQNFEVTAVDNSVAMLQQAKKRELSGLHQVTWLLGDMRTLELSEQFDGVIAAFDVFNYVESLTEFESLLKGLRSLLRPSAPILFDINAAYAFRTGLFNEEYLSESGQYWHSWRGDWDETTRKVRVCMTFFYEGRRMEECHTQFGFEAHEVRRILENLNFSDILVLDSESLCTFYEKTDRFLVSARVS